MQTRTVEVVVSLVLLTVASVVMYDSSRLGAGWGFDGPETGYFPFYVALILLAASLVNLVQAVRHRSPDPFVGWSEFKRVIAVLAPTAVYVAAIPFIGIYVAAALFIAWFMVMLGGYRPAPAIATGCLVPLVFFVLFEVWFLVPLPKGPLEAALGY